MINRAHLIAGLLAPLCIATFLLSTLLTGLFGSNASVAQLKSLIVTPGLWIMVPLMAAAGGSGMFLARSCRGRLAEAKKKRMPFIVANGLLVLVPYAIVLDQWASAGKFNTTFHAVRVIELVAGATNLALMSLNARDGLRMAGRLRSGPAVAANAQ